VDLDRDAPVVARGERDRRDLRADLVELPRPIRAHELAAADAPAGGPVTPLARLVIVPPPADLAPLVDLWCALLAAGMVGGTAACLDMTVAYAKDRYQFNRPIGSFQAVKHRCAEMLVSLDGARAAAQYAVFAADEGSDELPRVAPLAKAEASDAYTFAAGGTIQVLGGIGFTWEHDAHLYFRRAWADAGLLGSPAAQRARVADALGIDREQVSVKGKTNEGVDSVGEGASIAVHAVALITVL
jgi:hypothetical protein